jgi:acyl transferase domain-containing protein/acyl-CoA synthetase (AMP-forming)/AMP-acid ligase II/acyl carrier protein
MLNSIFDEALARVNNLVELLRFRAKYQTNKLAYTFLFDGENEKASLTYGALDRVSRGIAGQLQNLGAEGQRALLFYPSSLDFIAAFFGCLYAEVVAVPTYPPRLNRPDTRLQVIAQDSQAKVALTTKEILLDLEPRLAQMPILRNLHWIATDNQDSHLAEEWIEPKISSDTLAFLQYTSGSTATPKGVMVTHANILHNLLDLDLGWQHTFKSVMVSWLPLFHDMGLIYGVLQPLYNGFSCYLMPPASFIQRPFRWLQAISRYRATHSAGPNFAYELCVRTIGEDQRNTLNLSHWQMALNAAEPVREETMSQFAKYFKSAGFDFSAFCPGYGLAEATLKVTAVRKKEMRKVIEVQADALAEHRVVEVDKSKHEAVQTLVGCGQSEVDTKVMIVDSHTLMACPSDRVGEIWVHGPSIAQGYWGRPEETEQTFGVYLKDTGEGPFLRTGDLGFIRDGELFITGRLKDMIIIRGLNHYPQDIELTVERCHPALRLNSGAAFAVEVDGHDHLVIVQEVERTLRHNLNVDEVVQKIREAVAQHHELQVYAVVLVRAFSIPKTSSGKIQRHACRTAFLKNTLQVVGQWQLKITGSIMGEVRECDTCKKEGALLIAKPIEAIEAWLVQKLSSYLSTGPEHIDTGEPLSYFGLDSKKVVSLSGQLADWLGCNLSPTLFYDYPSIDALLRYFGDQYSGIKIGSGNQKEEKKAVFQKDDDESLAIAVIGMGCRFPGAKNPEAFWQLLYHGTDPVREVPASRWNAHAFYEPTEKKPGKMNTIWGGFLDDVEFFDSQFFGISPREAERMDPQQRLLLEVSWEALEHAGQVAKDLAQTGVFVGISSYDYAQIQGRNLGNIDAYFGTGIALSIAANRLSYFLDLHGPSVAVDTACSSSLVAVHQACQSLRLGECNMAIVGGVNLMLTPALTITFSHAGMMAADGRCKTFDASADGYVRSEGCGMIVLKRFSDSLRDKDRILAIIRGSAVNQDGRSNGLTAPNGPAQKAVICQALDAARVLPNEISYIEAHGTGTPLGDPIEVNAIKRVLIQQGLPSQRQPCWIGSVKSNIGHLEAAAGIAGLIKVILCLQHGIITPNLHLKNLNPRIDLDDTLLSIPTKPQTWTVIGHRFAGVSSFGFGGTNAHCIVQESPTASLPLSAPSRRPVHVLTLSAKTQEALKQQARNYDTHLRSHQDESLASVCFTANTGRAHFEYRLAVVAQSSCRELADKLRAYGDNQDTGGLVYGQVNRMARKKVAFLFSGQGSQYAGMGRQLYETQPTFRNALKQCDTILTSLLEKSILEVMYPEDRKEEGLKADRALVDETVYTQPALFALEYALVQLWKSWGIEPAVVMGHSVGEYVAACVAGLWSLEDGLRLIAKRAQLMNGLHHNGEMAVVFADEGQVAKAIYPYRDKVSIAAVNGPQNVVISGTCQHVEALVAAFKVKGIKTVKLNVSHAFHSPLIEPIVGEFEKIAKDVSFLPLQIELISNLTGQPATASLGTAEYWCRHAREPVRFADAMATLWHHKGCEIFVEIGPTPVLLGMGRQCLPESAKIWLPSLCKGKDDWQQMLSSLSELYIQGIPIDWCGFDRDYSCNRINLPTYPFQRQRYWLKDGEDRPIIESVDSSYHPLLGQKKRLALKEIIFESRLSPKKASFLMEHRVFQTPIVPASVYLEMALAAGAAIFKTDTLVVHDVVIHHALILNEVKQIQCILTPETGQEKRYKFQILSCSETEDENGDIWICHASGKVSPGGEKPLTNTQLPVLDLWHGEELSLEAYYCGLQQQGIGYGPSFQAIVQLKQRQGEALGLIQMPESLTAEVQAYKVHPVLLDASFQVFGALLSKEEKEETYLQVGLERMEIYARSMGTSLLSHVRRVDTNQGVLEGDFSLMDPDGRLVAKIKGLRVQKITPSLLPVEGNIAPISYEILWQPKTLLANQLFSDNTLLPNEEYGRVLSQMESLSAAYVVMTFKKMGWRFEPGYKQPQFLPEMVNQRWQPLLRRLQEILEEEGIICRKDSQWEVVKRPEFPEPAHHVKTLLMENSSFEAELTLLSRCGAKLADVLMGQCDPVKELLFPQGDLTLLSRLYQESPLAKKINNLVQRAFSSLLDRVPPWCTLRVVEIGAGTGGTTAYVLPPLSTQTTEYVFTDVSAMFITHGQKKFCDYPFVQYQLLDIEEEPERQGFHPHKFDVVLASNVLHAARSLRKTLEHIRKLLAPGGVLIMVEGTSRQRWLDLIFGLTEGWWHFTDYDLRPTYPLLSLPQWQKLLQDSGFIQSEVLGDSGVFGQSVIVAKTASEQKPVESGRWLIFADNQGIGERLKAYFHQKAEVVDMVFPGQAYDEIAPHGFTVRPDCLDDFQRLLQRDDKALLRGVVHLWGVDGALKDIRVEDLEAVMEKGCGSVLYLIQSLLKANRAESPPCLWLVTQGSVATAMESDMPGLAQSLLWGMGKVIAQEHPEFHCVCMDLDPNSTIEDEASALFEEVWSKNTQGEDQIAFRQGQRYVARLVQGNPYDLTKPFRLRPDSTYLITGGLGGIGLRVAQWMVACGARSLVLVGRSKPSEAVQEMLNAIKEVSIVTIQADVSEAEEVARLIAQIEQSLPELKGVIHCAGIFEDRLLCEHEWDLFRKVFAPKVFGAWNLHQFTQKFELDFFVLFSSAASLVGGSGLSNYVAANTFLDMLAHYRQMQGLPGLSISWGPWAGVGMAAALNEKRKSQWAIQGMEPLQEHQAIKMLEYLLRQQDKPHVGVMQIDWSKFLKQSSESSQFLAHLAQGSDRPPVQQKNRLMQQLSHASNDHQQRELLEEHVRVQVASVLGIDAPQLIEPHKGFFELGMDSLTSIELRNRLQNSLQCALPTTLTFKYPTIDSLVNYLKRDILSLDSESQEAPAVNREDTIFSEVKGLAKDELEAMIEKELTAFDEWDKGNG